MISYGRPSAGGASSTKRILAFAIVIASIGCSAPRIKLADTSSVVLGQAENSPDAAEIVVIRKKSIVGQAVGWSIDVDGVTAFSIGSGRHTKFFVEPGEHSIGVTPPRGAAAGGLMYGAIAAAVAQDPKVERFTCAPKGKYYFLVSAGEVKPLSEEDGRKYVAETEYDPLPIP